MDAQTAARFDGRRGAERCLHAKGAGVPVRSLYLIVYITSMVILPN